MGDLERRLREAVEALEEANATAAAKSELVSQMEKVKFNSSTKPKPIRVQLVSSSRMFIYRYIYAFDMAVNMYSKIYKFIFPDVHTHLHACILVTAPPSKLC